MRHPSSLEIGFLILLPLIAISFVPGCTGSQPPAQPPQGQTPAGNVASAPTGSAMKDTVLKFGRIPFANATDMVPKHEALMNYLRDELGVKETRLVLDSSYHNIMARLGRGEIDIAWLGTFSYAEGRGEYKMKLLVKPRRFGSTSYRGIIITRQDSGIRTLQDLKGKKFAWVEKESASGYLFPKALLFEKGVNPDRDFTESSFLGKHDSVVLAVLLGKFDAGACYDDARNTLREKSKMNDLTILATTENISNEPIVVRSDLPEDLVEKIRKAFLKLDVDNPHYKKVLEECTDVQGFVPAQDSDYDYIEKAYKVLQSKQ